MRRLQLLATALPLLHVILLVFPGLAQLPPNNCFPEFQYRGYQGQYIGQITLRLDPQLVLYDLSLEMSQKGVYNFTNNVGSISLVDSDATTVSNVRQNLPVTYRVDFPLPGSPPKITGIRLNHVEICSASKYSQPRTGITLVHRLTLSTSIGGNGVNSEASFPPTQSLSPIRNPNLSVGDWEESFPTRNPIRSPSRNPNRNPEGSVVSQTFFERNDTLLGPEGLNSAGEPIPQIRQPSPSWATTSSRPEINNRETLVSQQAPSSGVSLQCGRERATTTPLVFQGTRLERGKMPWLVGMFERRESNGPIFFCGGSLISASTVLTAAHCFRIPGFRDLPASRTAVSLGRNTLDLLSTGEFRGVSQLLIHEKYQYERYTEADLALARLESPVPFSNFIVPICLWSSAYRMDLPQGEQTYVAGWGPDEAGTGNSDVAKVADMNIVSEARCLRELPPGPLFQPSTLCAQKAGTGPCATDGGGPLMLREGDVWVLRGVIAGGAHDDEKNTCDLTRPSVFTDVAKHIDWVRRNMWN